MVLERKRPDRPADPGAVERGLTDDVWNLMERCWLQEWEQRPPVNEVLDCLKVALATSNASRRG